jgi:hypothetical protein
VDAHAYGTDAANQAGFSRRFGGIHFRMGDLAGRAAGDAVGIHAWEKANRLWTGKK